MEFIMVLFNFNWRCWFLISSRSVWNQFPKLVWALLRFFLYKLRRNFNLYKASYSDWVASGCPQNVSYLSRNIWYLNLTRCHVTHVMFSTFQRIWRQLGRFLFSLRFCYVLCLAVAGWGGANVSSLTYWAATLRGGGGGGRLEKTIFRPEETRDLPSTLQYIPRA